MTAATQPLHATAVARHTPAGWRGVLIQGPSGVGKSDLALKLIGQGWRLIADDWTHVWASGGALYAAAPATITGKIEVRGLGIVAAPLWPLTLIRLAVTCTTLGSRARATASIFASKATLSAKGTAESGSASVYSRRFVP